MKNYELNSYADGFGLWHCKVVFPFPGLGNSGEAERIKYNGLDAAKRRIRKEIKERQAQPVKKLSYYISENYLDSINRLHWFIVSEK
jgi:hypothetical protein